MRPLTVSCSGCGVVTLDARSNENRRRWLGAFIPHRCPHCGADLELEVSDARGAA